MRIPAVLAVATCVGLACGPLEAQTGEALSKEDVAKINEVSETLGKAILAKDWATLADVYTDDAVVCPPNQPAVKGRAAIQAWLETFPPVTEYNLNSVRVEGRDDLAYVLGTYAMTIEPPGAPGPVKDTGKYVEIRRKQPDGRWLVAVDIFNSDLPVVPPK